MKKGELLSKMISFAAQMHEGQLDRGGKPYILHVLQVMFNLGNIEDEELQCIGVGHDLFEDTKATEEDLRNLGCGDRIISGIYNVTKMPGESYEKYVNKVSSSLDSIRVKKADLEHNSDIKRLKGVSEKDLARQAKYQALYALLDEREKNMLSA